MIAEFVRTLDPSTVVGKPDMLTVLWPTSLAPAVLCANQCIRDKDHKCMVLVTSKQLLNGEWVGVVSLNPAWMVLTWGQHRHTLPFCCVRCMFEFVNERLVAQGDAPFPLDADRG